MADAPASTPKIDSLRAKVAADPKSRHFYPLAEELRKIGQLEEAERVLRSGLEHHSTYLSAWISLGRVLKDKGAPRDAVDVLVKALSLDPENVVAAKLLANVYLLAGEKVEAIKKFKLVHALMPADEDAEEQIAMLERELHPEGLAGPPPSAGPVTPQIAATPEPESGLDSAGPPFLEEEVPPPASAPSPAMAFGAGGADGTARPNFDHTNPDPFALGRQESDSLPSTSADALFDSEPEPEAASPLGEGAAPAPPDVEMPASSPPAAMYTETPVPTEIPPAQMPTQMPTQPPAPTPTQPPVSMPPQPLAPEPPQPPVSMPPQPLASPPPAPVQSRFEPAPIVESPRRPVSGIPADVELPEEPAPFAGAELPEIPSEAGQESDPFGMEETASPPPRRAPSSEDVWAEDEDGEQDSGEGIATVTMAQILEQQGYLERAKETYERVLERDPFNDAAREGLNQLVQRLRTREEAGGKVSRLQAWRSKVARP